jgi:hypothetical protein
MSRYIPQDNNGRVAWSLNFENKFPSLAESLGFGADEIKSFIDDSRMMRFVILSSQVSSAFSKTCTAFKNEMLGGVGEGITEPQIPVYQSPTVPPNTVKANILERLSNALQRAKLHPNFNQTIAEQLMYGTNETPQRSFDDAKPKVTATALVGGVVRLDWTKSKFDGVFIDSQRGSETDWKRLDFDMRSPFEDMRPLLEVGKPEQRRYRLIYFIDNKPVGLWSDTINTSATP